MDNKKQEKGPAEKFVEKMDQLRKRPVSQSIIKKINESVETDNEPSHEDKRKIAQDRPKEADL